MTAIAIKHSCDKSSETVFKRINDFNGVRKMVSTAENLKSCLSFWRRSNSCLRMWLLIWNLLNLRSQETLHSQVEHLSILLSKKGSESQGNI